jgi:hypothetical protein
MAEYRIFNIGKFLLVGEIAKIDLILQLFGFRNDIL